MDHLLTLLRAAAEDTRLRILALAAREDLTVSDYVHVLGQSQPRVSRHLKLLVEAGLLERFREAQFTRFRLRHLAATMPPWCASSCAGSIPSMPASPPTARGSTPCSSAARPPRCASSATTPSAGTNCARCTSPTARSSARCAHHLPVGARRLLDIGTGTGRLLEVLAPKVEQAIGVDQSREMLALARANLARAGIDNADIRPGRHVCPALRGRQLRRRHHPPRAALRRRSGGGAQRGGARRAARAASCWWSISRRTTWSS